MVSLYTSKVADGGVAVPRATGQQLCNKTPTN
jgi:hypothetical protein